MYVDSDYAIEREGRRSILGYIAILEGYPMLWTSRRQKSVVTSTSEAEYMALFGASKQALWLRQLFA